MPELGPDMSLMTWTEVRRAVELEYIPVLVAGSTEQHGPHLPLATDVLIPSELVRRLSRRARVLLAPSLHFGFKSKARSGGGQTFPGTTSLDGETLIHVVRDVVGEIGRHGFKRLIVLNWHMENVNFVWEGIDQARRDGRLGEMVVLSIDSLAGSFSPADLAWLFPDGLPGWDVEHASMFETSLMLALRPEDVRSAQIRDDAAAEHPWYDLTPEPARHIPRSGVLANPTQASREIGERLTEMMLERLCEAIEHEFGAMPADSCPSPERGFQTAVISDGQGPPIGSPRGGG
jgi:creatinine amidohydrolase